MSDSDRLLKQLGKTLKSEKQTTAPNNAVKASSSNRSTPKQTAIVKTESSTNRNFSIYQRNYDTLFEIQNLIRKKTGQNCSISRALQVALELCPMKDIDKMVTAFEKYQELDGRSQKQKK